MKIRVAPVEGEMPIPEASTEAALREALVDSRERWRDLVDMAGDLAF